MRGTLPASEQMKDWLNVAHKGPGSVTLVTTRERGACRKLDKVEEEMPLLSNNDSLELFRSQAFPDDSL